MTRVRRRRKTVLARPAPVITYARHLRCLARHHRHPSSLSRCPWPSKLPRPRLMIQAGNRRRPLHLQRLTKGPDDEA